MGWHGVATATPGQQDAILLPPLRISLRFPYGCLIIVAAKERSPKILVEINVGLCTSKKFKLFLHTLYTSDCDNMKYEISSQILYHVIPLVKICRPGKTGLATGLQQGNFLTSGSPGYATAMARSN